MNKIILRYAFNNANWTPNKPEWLKGMSCIQNEERHRIAGYAFQRDSKASMIGRLMIRRVVTELLNIDNTEVRLERTEKGRPYLNCSDLPHISDKLDFNVSHHGDYTVLTAGFGVKTGVDVMKVHLPVRETTEEYFNLMKRQFHEQEWKVIKQPNNDFEKMRLFYRHWCLKESYLKALGIGIGVDLDHIVCKLSLHSEPYVNWIDQDSSQWKFEEHSLDNSHLVAVSWNGIGVKNQVKYSKFNELTFPDLLVNMNILHRAESDYWTNFRSKPDLPNYLKQAEAEERNEAVTSSNKIL